MLAISLTQLSQDFCPLGEKKKGEAICTFVSFNLSFKGYFSTEDASLEKASTQICENLRKTGVLQILELFECHDGIN